MSWAVGYDDSWHRDIGYGVPATCDHPGCGAEIHRGLAYLCGTAHQGDEGCGLFFCTAHGGGPGDHCERCRAGAEPFTPTPDLRIWNDHKLNHASWQRWRDECPDEFARLLALTNKENGNG